MTEEKEITVLDPQTTGIVPVVIPSDLPTMDKLLMAANNGMDIGTIEKFMDLVERNQQLEAKQAYHKAFAEFKKDPPKIVKDALVDFKKKDGSRTKYNHVSLGNLTFGIIAGMAKQGLSHNWTLSQNGNLTRVTCVVTHFLGYSESTFLEASADISGGKNAIQGIGSTVKYLERYTLEAISGIAVFEKDDDGQSHKEPDPKQQQQQKQKPTELANNPQNVAMWVKWMDDNAKKGCTAEQLDQAFETHVIVKKASFSEEDYAELLDYKNDLAKEIQQKGE